MGRKTEPVTIDGETYEITQLGAVEGIELYHELVRCFGPLLREELGKSDSEDAETTIGRVLIRAIESMPRDLMRELRTKFAANCKVTAAGMPLEMNPQIFDQHFAGRYGLFTKWMIHCLRFNFGGFLGGGAQLAGAPAAPTR